jgi:nitrogen fixation protein NifB
MAAVSGPTESRPCVAVATTDGAEVNEHLGHATKFLVYKAAGGHGRMEGVRDAPPKGGGGSRWAALAEVLPDCFALLVADAGDSPRQALYELGIEVRSMPGAAIEDAVADALGLQKKKR